MGDAAARAGALGEPPPLVLTEHGVGDDDVVEAASAKTSVSAVLAHVMPTPRASICIRAIPGTVCVLMCGRRLDRVRVGERLEVRDVALHAVGVDKQRRRGDLVDVLTGTRRRLEGVRELSHRPSRVRRHARSSHATGGLRRDHRAEGHGRGGARSWTKARCRAPVSRARRPGGGRVTRVAAGPVRAADQGSMRRHMRACTAISDRPPGAASVGSMRRVAAHSKGPPATVLSSPLTARG